ncbi:MAG: hypothetical protein PHH30_00985, partial [Bacteroidales bacterium]|nr:hypothetical protein [Bacteroidales bacterium]
MKYFKLYIVFLLVLSSFATIPYTLHSQSVTATYTAGVGKTDVNFYDLSGASSCPLPISVTIPDGAEITGVEIEYKMTDVLYGMKADQISQLRCVSSGG